MKKLSVLFLFLAVLAAGIALSACKVPGETKSAKERMDGFIADVNASNWGALNGHTSKSSLMHYLASDSFWETNFSAGIPWTVTSAGTTSVATGNGLTYTFTLEESDPDFYVIRKISNGAADFFN